MEPNDVLKRFLDVCSNKDDKCTRYSFASNGVLEWFGRNVKDNKKIFEYIRYNISHQYEHIFSAAIRCGAFEEKPLHKATRQQLPDTVTNAIDTKSEDIFETPPNCSASKECDDMATPEKKIRTEGTASNEKQKFSDTDEEKPCPQSPRITRNSRKRNSHVPQPASPTKRSKSNSGNKSEQPVSSCPVPDLSKDSPHVDVSEIKYIEAVGTVRKLRKLKHRGIDSRSKDVRIYESPTRNHWEAENTKLKISYRENVNESDLQFVLAIYQHIENNPRCRRDLMAEFAKTCADETPESSQKSEKKCKTKSSKMRRLRF